MEMYNISYNNHTLPFWDIYQIFKKHANLNLNAEDYVFLFRSVSNIIMFEKKAELVRRLSKFNLKIFGDGPWEKYASGNIEVCGPCDIQKSIEIMNKSKIVLNPHTMQNLHGLHERVLNASALGKFVLSSDSPLIKSEFKDSLGYFNYSNFEDLESKVEYFLKNDNEREQKAQIAKDIVINNHTWDNRAKKIIEIFGIN